MRLILPPPTDNGITVGQSYDSDTLQWMFNQDTEGLHQYAIYSYDELKSVNNKLSRTMLKNTIKQHKDTLQLAKGVKLKEFGLCGVRLRYAVRDAADYNIYVLVTRGDKCYVYKRFTFRWCSLPLYGPPTVVHDVGTGAMRTEPNPIWYDTLTIGDVLLSKGYKCSYYKTVTIGFPAKEVPDCGASGDLSMCYCIEDYLSVPMWINDVFRLNVNPIAQDKYESLFIMNDGNKISQSCKLRDRALQTIEKWEASCL